MCDWFVRKICHIHQSIITQKWVVTHRGLEHREDEGEGEEHLDQEVASVEREGRVPQQVRGNEAPGQEGSAEAADGLLGLWLGRIV